MEREPHAAAYRAHRALSILSSPRAIASPLILSLCLSQGPRETRNGRRGVRFCECKCVRFYDFEWVHLCDCEWRAFLRLRARALLRLATANACTFATASACVFTTANTGVFATASGRCRTLLSKDVKPNCLRLTRRAGSSATSDVAIERRFVAISCGFRARPRFIACGATRD